MSISINKKYSFEISINSPTILVRNHSQLDQLDYESSGHTGFASSDEFSSHIENTNNPHSVTKTQVGLENTEDGAQINVIELIKIDGDDLVPDENKRITLPDKEPSFEKNTAFNKDFGTTEGTVCEGNDTRLSDDRNPLSHTHGDITNDGKIGSAADKVVVTTDDGKITTTNRSGIDSRSTFPPDSHTHDDRYYTESEVDTLLGDKVDKVEEAGLITDEDYEHLTNIISGDEAVPKVDVPLNRLIYCDINDNYTYINPARIEYLSKLCYIKVKNGRFKCKYNNSSGRKWTFPTGTVVYETSTPISTSTDATVDVTITATSGYVILYSNNWIGGYDLNITDSDCVVSNLSDLPALTYYLSLNNCSLITGSLADLPALTYYLSLYKCSLITGDLSDLPALTYYLSLYNCSLITGDLSDLPALTYYLSLYNCSSITGSLADLPALTYYLSLSNCSSITGSLADLPAITNTLGLSNCSSITGSYTAVNGNNVPTTTILTGTGLSATDMDNTLIAYASCTKNNGTFTATNKNRTAASDDAVATLLGRGWAINGLIKI